MLVRVLAHPSPPRPLQLALILQHSVYPYTYYNFSTPRRKDSTAYDEYCSLQRIPNEAGYRLHLVQYSVHLCNMCMYWR